MTCVSERMHLSLRIGTSEHLSILYPNSWIIVRFNDQNRSRPALQIARRDLRLPRTLKQTAVLMCEHLLQKVRSKRFVQVSAAEIQFRMFCRAQRRKHGLFQAEGAALALP